MGAEMIAILLSLVLATSSADADAAAALALAKAQRDRPKLSAVVAAPKVKYVGNWSMPGYATGTPGVHRHHCEKCGFDWYHHDSPPPNKIEDHICPNCKALPPGARAVAIP